jgi:hypothetical protein
MKKLLSIILAAMMLLSFTAAMAEKATELTAGITFDTETAISMVQMLGGMTDESQLSLVRSVLAIANNLTAVTTADSTGGDTSLRLSGQEFANFAFGQADGKIAVTSSLFPNYALTVDPALLEQAMKENGFNMDPEMAKKAMEAITAYGKDFEDYAAAVSAGIVTTQGAFTVDGVLYTSFTTGKVTSDQAASFFLAVLDRAEKDTVLQEIITTLMAQTGNTAEMNIPDTLSAVRTQITAAMQAGSADLVTLKYYTNETGFNYIVETTPQYEEMAIRLTATGTTLMGGSSSTFQLFFVDTAVTDWDAAIQEMQSGQSDSGLLLQGTMDTSLTATDNRSSGSVQILAGGMGSMSIGLTAQSVIPFDEAAAKTFTLGLGIGTGNPLVTFSFGAAPALMAKPVDLTGKTVIAVSMDMTEETMAPLLSDITANGVPALLARLQEIAPEASLLINLLMAGSQTTEQPVPAATANP